MNYVKTLEFNCYCNKTYLKSANGISAIKNDHGSFQDKLEKGEKPFEYVMKRMA
jgi:hypothetical protein